MSDTETGAPIDPSDVIDWSAGDDEPAKFITNTIVQVGDSELVLLLYEVMAPYVYAPPQSPEKFAEKWISKLPLKANCYGRFVLTPERAGQLVDLLNMQLDLYWDNQRKKREAFLREQARRSAATEEEFGAPSETNEDEEL